MKKYLLCLAASLFVMLATNLASGATVPAGTSLIVQTLETITSQDSPGTRFSAQLATNVVVGKKTVLPAGTHFSAKVITSRRIVSTSQRLTVDLTSATIHGRTVPIKTTGAVQVDNTNFKTKNDRYVGRAAYSVRAGKYLEFHLAQPLAL
jgi:hypothetical protein